MAALSRGDEFYEGLQEFREMHKELFLGRDEGQGELDLEGGGKVGGGFPVSLDYLIHGNSTGAESQTDPKPTEDENYYYTGYFTVNNRLFPERTGSQLPFDTLSVTKEGGRKGLGTQTGWGLGKTGDRGGGGGGGIEGMSMCGFRKEDNDEPPVK
ncbi:hypothetical protein HK102_010058 [Quaeritorhiza haematococci]|nr:hypothetical protein HK102_010058 [Quaeritorhiza haematococci]